MTPSRAQAAAPAIAAAIVLALAPAGMVAGLASPWLVWAVLAAVVAWAALCFRHGRFGDGGILSVAATALAIDAAGVWTLFLPLLPFVPAVAVLVLARWRDPPSPPLPWARLGRFGWSGAVAALLVAGLAALAAGGAVALANRLGPGALWTVEPMMRPWMASMGMTPLDLASRAAVVGVTFGIAEEAVFRGALQERLTAALGPWPGVLGQAAAYAVYCVLPPFYATASNHHGGLRGGAGLVVGLALGLLLGVLRRLADGLFAPVVAHALANAAIVAWLALLVPLR